MVAFATAHGPRKARASDLPRYCKVFTLLERSCGAARLVVKMYGEQEAERRARICGATDTDIEQARSCIKGGSQ